CIVREDCAIYGAELLLSKHTIFAAQPKQVAEQRGGFAMAVALGMIQLRSLESLGISRIREAAPHLFDSQAAKLSEESSAPFFDQLRQIRLVVREIKEWTGGREFLTLKNHGS